MEKYDCQQIEFFWQQYWEKHKIFSTNLSSKKPKYYVLDMFPYPSGSGLHIGHPRGYTATDIMAKYKKLQGFEVLHPIGWDSFGLPAEQYAIEQNKNPDTFVNHNIANFKKQLKQWGFSFDYDKEIKTSDPKYYKWTQWIFIQLFKKGFALKKTINVNWCEKLRTVLANEEVIFEDGKMLSERGSHEVVKKPMKQWVLKITEYAESLADGLKNVKWPTSIIKLQKNWIGIRKGFEIELSVVNSDKKIKVFSTNVENMTKVSFIVLAPENDFLKSIQDKQILQFIADTKNTSDIERMKKTENFATCFTNIWVKNVFTDEKIPVYVSDYVNSKDIFDLRLGMPELSSKDKIFANENEIKTITQNKKISWKVIKPIIKEKIEYLLKDWIFSRQRYWGEPIPVFTEEKNSKLNTVDETDLPLELPHLESYRPNNIDGFCPLDQAKKWKNTIYKNQAIIRETNTMPQWAGSSWYFIAYLLKQKSGDYLPLNSPEAKKIIRHWLPIDLYVGGQEHAVLHLLYARFWNLFLYDIGITTIKEPFYRLINQGMILGEDGEKMSKSKGNGINPSPLIREYGADSLRIYEMFIGPISEDIKWNNQGLSGCWKWIKRVYRLSQTRVIYKKNNLNQELHIAFNKLIKNASLNIETLKFNVLISELMIFINKCYKFDEIEVEIFNKFLIILCCVAPHVSEELWKQHGNKKSIFNAEWPKINSVIVSKQEIKVLIQVNGKLRGCIQLNKELKEKELVLEIRKIQKIEDLIKNSKIKRIIYIRNKIINFVI